MEGNPDQPPSALIPFSGRRAGTRFRRSTSYQSEIGGPLRGGDPGVRVIEPRAGTPPPFFDRIPPPFEAAGDEWLVVPLYHIFGSEELSVLGAGHRRTHAAPHTSRSTRRRSPAAGSRRRRGVGRPGRRVASPRRARSASMPPGIAGVPSACRRCRGSRSAGVEPGSQRSRLTP